MQNNKHDVLLLDPKGLIGDVESETFKRHLKYSQILGQEYPNARLIIFSTTRDQKNIIYQSKNFNILNYFDSTKRLYKKSRFKASDLAQLNLEPKILISGEPFETFLYTLFLRKRIRKRIPIQLQIHFDPNQFKKSRSLLDKSKYIFMLSAILFCDSLRLVNELQLNSIPKKIYGSKKITICPLPVTIASEGTEIYTSNRPRNIGIFGRIHPERGLQTILRSLSLLPKDFYNKVVIAGDGDSKESFISDLKEMVGEERVIYLGNLNRERQRMFWENIGILMSFPEFEAYGISMRESIAYGIPVVATHTIGSELLATECSNSEIRILSNPTDSLELMRNIELGFNTKTTAKFMFNSEKNSKENQKKLVFSWLYPL